MSKHTDRYIAEIDFPHSYGGKTIADAVGAVNAPRRTAEYNGR
jgi:hypothetical protein